MPAFRPFKDRFWEKVEKRGKRDCWLWKAGRNVLGYGTTTNARKSLLAHRASWEIHHGPIPKGLCVLHRCDNPPCVNPSHLFLGTDKDNSDDKIKKGRINDRVGAANGRARLTDRQVIDIRAARGLQKDIAKQYGITVSHVCQIKKGKAWSHVT